MNRIDGEHDAAGVGLNHRLHDDRHPVIGEWLDITVDTVVHAALVLALGVAATRVSGVGLVAGVIAAAGVVASGAVGKLWPPAPATASERGLLDPLTSRDGFYAMLLLFLALRRWAASAPPAPTAPGPTGASAGELERLQRALDDFDA